MRDQRSWLLSFVLTVGLGCTGAIDDAGGRTGTPGPGGPSGTGGANVLPPGMTPEPNRVTLRRLNQNEYDNTVRDLLGTASRPGKTFIGDGVANGFDNNGDRLGLSPVRMEQYQQAAETLAGEALAAPLRARNLTCDPAAGDACVRTFLTTMGERAYRRPLTEEEIGLYLQMAAKVRGLGGSPEEVINAVLQALLIAPDFLFRPEIDPDPKSVAPHLLTSYEVASRLSYLVYGSMPDDMLFAAAKMGKLGSAKDLQAQVQRMLADPKSRLSQDYAEQWLGVRTVETAQPDPKLYASFNAALGLSMKREVDLFFDEVIRQNLSVDQLLTANFTYLDDSLAKHYGLPAVGSATDPTRVTLSTPQRGGLLGMGALLVATSRGNRTSPVSRGRFTLDALMCAPPPPPPGDFKPPAEETIVATDARTFLDEHRKNPACFSCHNEMDPIGLALENYDAVGAWRVTDHGKTIDASGMLVDGTKFDGRAGLEAALAKDPRFAACLAKNLLEYSLGRSLVERDQGYIDQVVKTTGGAPMGVRDVLMNVVASDAFRMRRGEP